jgi:hypothetical protein
VKYGFRGRDTVMADELKIKVTLMAYEWKN